MSKVSENGVVRDMTAEEQAAFDAITTQATTDNNANKYKLERSKSYPAIAEQLDMIYKAIDADNDLKTKFSDFHTAIKTVKDNNPKPE
tara:strand:+ start:210 stop:473 length:264 start_codon:yes stop_codon:yes gene_type:complete